MKLKNPLVYTLALLTLPFVGTVAQATTIEIMKTFDFPGVGNSTLPQKVSDEGDVGGILLDASGVEHAFIYKIRLGKFSSPFSEPNDTGMVTRGRGINNFRYVCGEYLNGSDLTFHGYILEHPDFVGFDIPGALDTVPLGINNANDFAGTFTFNDGSQPGFLNVRGHLIIFSVPGATATFAYQLNKTNQSIGYYLDPSGIAHGFTRDGVGNLAFPLDVPGSTETMLLGNNDLNWGVGRYTDAAGATHGLFFITPDSILTYDYPGAASYTTLNGVNKQGQICGDYMDASGIFHAFIAKAIVSSSSNRETNISVGPPVKPAHPSAEMLRAGAPVF